MNRDFIRWLEAGLNKDFNILLEDIEKYNSNVKQDYEDFQHVQVVWKKLKKTITENNKKLVIAQ